LSSPLTTAAIAAGPFLGDLIEVPADMGPAEGGSPGRPRTPLPDSTRPRTRSTMIPRNSTSTEPARRGRLSSSLGLGLLPPHEARGLIARQGQLAEPQLAPAGSNPPPSARYRPPNQPPRSPRLLAGVGGRSSGRQFRPVSIDRAAAARPPPCCRANRIALTEKSIGLPDASEHPRAGRADRSRNA
jgi:hypothetical protein